MRGSGEDDRTAEDPDTREGGNHKSQGQGTTGIFLSTPILLTGNIVS